MRKKDVVLMATVTSFEDLKHPTKHELKQFAELFRPLYSASTDEARRQAVAALSQNPNIPPSVAFFIASQSISIAAPFIASSPCLDDEMLISIARMQGADHAKAIVRRPDLSPEVVDALVSMRHAKARAEAPATKAAHDLAPAKTEEAPAAASALAGTLLSAADQAAAREEALRQKIKQLAAMQQRPSADRLGLRATTDVQEALLVRFARARDADAFATCLADTLSSSRWLAERIMMDISGQQLATTLKALGMAQEESFFILERLYGHLKEMVGDVARSEILWASLDEHECIRRLEAWCRADRYTYADTDGLTANVSPKFGTAEPDRLTRRTARG